MDQIIADLLIRHNCVIIPSFGGFVAKPVSARIDFEKGIMLPPSKSLLFNKQLVNNDGLLVTEIAKQKQLSYEDAFQEIRNEVTQWNSMLQHGKRIELDQIGFLYLDAEKNLCFEQDRFVNLLLESFGLGQVHFIAEEDLIRTEKHPLITREESPIQELKTSAKIISIEAAPKPAMSPVAATGTGKKVMRYVAAACLLPLAFYSFWIPLRTDVLESGVLSLNDFNPFYHTEAGSYRQREIKIQRQSDKGTSLNEALTTEPINEDHYAFQYDDTHTIQVKLDSGDDSQGTQDAVNQSEAFTPAVMNYIVGCFGNETNATNLVAKLKSNGLDARIVDVQNGLHRVSAGSAASEEALTNIISEVNRLGMNGWVLK